MKEDVHIVVPPLPFWDATPFVPPLPFRDATPFVASFLNPKPPKTPNISGLTIIVEFVHFRYIIIAAYYFS
jgi:hypothetical protein